MDASSFAWIGAVVLALAALVYARNEWRKKYKLYTASRCGHRTRRTGPVSGSGYSTVLQMPRNDSGSVDYCLHCIGEMIIRCAWCGDPISIGHPITLYSPKGDFSIPDYAVVFSENPLRLVGCLGWDCASSGADRAGFWLPGEDGKGRVQRVPTAYETILGAAEPSAVVVRDLRDIAEAMDPKVVPINGKKAR